MEYIKTAHSIYYLQYNVVWICKYRRRILKPGITSYLLSSVGVDEEPIESYVEH